MNNRWRSAVRAIGLCLIVTTFILSGYAQELPETSAKSDFNFKPISSGLYSDSSENIYFKALERKDINHPKARFISVVYSDQFGVQEMKDVVDAHTFEGLGEEYYKDKNHIYYFFIMSDGGSLSVVEQADVRTFEVFKNSGYGKDSCAVYYRGQKIEGADVSTFEPIRMEVRGRQVGWYARDQYHYYDGGRVTTKSEIME